MDNELLMNQWLKRRQKWTFDGFLMIIMRAEIKSCSRDLDDAFRAEIKSCSMNMISDDEYGYWYMMNWWTFDEFVGWDDALALHLIIWHIMIKSCSTELRSGQLAGYAFYGNLKELNSVNSIYFAANLQCLRRNTWHRQKSV